MIVVGFLDAQKHHARIIIMSLSQDYGIFTKSTFEFFVVAVLAKLKFD